MTEAVRPLPGNLPPEPASLVGREREVEKVPGLLAASRLVTLTGVGGVGKSRVALRVAWRLRERYPGGAWLVELGALRDPALIPHTVTAALGLSAQTVRSPLEVLADHLADRRVLLVLDGCEQLCEAAADLVTTLLAAAPGLAVLVTSRQALGVAGERRLVVRPLPVPAEDEEAAGPVPRERSEAVTLFLERAAAAVPGFTEADADPDQVARLCRRLDGIPLAIELAAVRLRTLTVEQLLVRLEDRFALLGTEYAEPPRHQTLRTAIGWSHELCTPGERLLWARLSVFAGGLDLAAAESVCADEVLPTAQVAELLAGLVDKSILLTQMDRGRLRFRLLDAIREYGAGWLSALGDESVMRRRHRDHYWSMAVQCEQEWHGSGQLGWYRRLTGEHANLRAALDYSLSDPAEAPAGLAMASVLWPFWLATGFLSEARHYLDRTLALASENDRNRPKALWVAAYVAVAQGALDDAAVSAELSGLAAIAAGDRYQLACAMQFSAMAITLQGEVVRGAEALLISAELHGPGDPADLIPLMGAGVRAFALNAQGEHDQAAELVGRVRARCYERGELWWRSHMDWLIAMIEIARGELARAERSAREALAAKRLFRDVIGIALCLEALAGAAASRGQAGRAARLHGAGEWIWRTFATPRFGAPPFAAFHDQAEREARAQIGDAAYERCAAEGAGLGMDEVIAFALGDEWSRFGALDRLERDVARLVAEGLADQEVAVKLGLGAEAVTDHVRSVLAKLGLASRTELAAACFEDDGEPSGDGPPP